MKYLLGVDGGGTKTVVAIANGFGEIVSLSTTDSVDVLNVSFEEVEGKLKNTLNEVLSKANVEIDDICFSCFGMSTFGDIPGTEKEIEAMIKTVLPKSIVVNDVRVALEGALPNSAGMILLAGTGAMAMAKDEDGRVFRVDGWGEHVGDLGSGYFIGRMVLQTAFEEYDGRRKQTPLLEMVKDFAKVSDLREILTRCKGSNVRTYIASFSKIACQAAEQGLNEASQILSTSVRELIKSAKALVKQLNFEPIPVSYAGGLFNCEYFRDKFKSLLENLPKVKVVEPEFLPYVGALVMAAKEVLNSEEWLAFYDGLHKNVKELSV
ncbi:MAG: BadF/BadG/BcrA/BcrD ATPase family protein [Candidatus Micrarchaeaceae archaeon]|nr:hypothetical protein [Candidatus Jingweiarchaeum tengchongense]